MLRRLLVPCAVLLLAASSAASSSASTIVYQCGPAVCAVDPDSTSGPRQLTADGRVAGVTRDGATAAWVASSPVRIVEAPVAGGAERALFTGEVYDDPRISPDGSKALWSWYLGGSGWYTYEYAGPPPSAGQYPPAIGSSTYQTSHGWLGERPLIARRGHDGSRSKVCDALAGNVGAGCTDEQALATEADTGSQIAFPDGAPDGSSIVAIRGPAPSAFGIPVAGTVALYSTTTRGRVRDLTPGATGDTHPVFSADGSRVAFERAGEIWVVDVAGGAPRRVATGTMPFWGGSRTTTEPEPGTPGQPGGPAPGGPGAGGPGTGGPGTGSGGGAGGGPAPRLAAALVGRGRISDLRRGRLRVRVTAPVAGRVRVTLAVSRATARRLGLGRRTTLATAGGRARTATSLMLRPRPSSRAARGLRRARSLAITLRASVTPTRGATRTTTRRVRLTR